ncbi:uncharacterized protein LOC118421032 [Branchiostoma floridae]|uniref:Uncharacterized protein LOC118421032 n=1 Tax=Branchiostoma floridae TaxID=7739 RepID=A0A9J7LLR7_BRAFL|nr:uncharacterized protein LOC118421032 [Branchiostoma floridae]
MSSSPGSRELLPRGRLTFGPTKIAWTTRCDHLQPRGDSAGRTRIRRYKTRHKPRTTSGTRDLGNDNVPASSSSTRPKSSFTWKNILVREAHQELLDPFISTLPGTPEFRSERLDEDIPRDPAPLQDPQDSRCVAVDEIKEELRIHYEESAESMDSKIEKAPLKRQPSCDSLFTRKHLKPAGVWRPYGPPLYGHGSALNPPHRKGPDTLVILATIFYCLAILTAVVFAVLFKAIILSGD